MKKLMTGDEAIARGAYAVSYTHLDVYKRQISTIGRVQLRRMAIKRGKS